MKIYINFSFSLKLRINKIHSKNTKALFFVNLIDKIIFFRYKIKYLLVFDILTGHTLIIIIIQIDTI